MTLDLQLEDLAPLSFSQYFSAETTWVQFSPHPCPIESAPAEMFTEAPLRREAPAFHVERIRFTAFGPSYTADTWKSQERVFPDGVPSPELRQTFAVNLP